MPREKKALWVFLNFYYIQRDGSYIALFLFFTFVSPGVSVMQASQTHPVAAFAYYLFDAIAVHCVMKYYHGILNGVSLMDLAWSANRNCTTTPIFI